MSESTLNQKARISGRGVALNGRSCGLGEIIDAAMQDDADLADGYRKILTDLAPDLIISMHRESNGWDGHYQSCWCVVQVCDGTDLHRKGRQGEFPILAVRDIAGRKFPDHATRSKKAYRSDQIANLRRLIGIGLGKAQAWGWGERGDAETIYDALVRIGGEK